MDQDCIPPDPDRLAFLCLDASPPSDLVVFLQQQGYRVDLWLRPEAIAPPWPLLLLVMHSTAIAAHGEYWQTLRAIFPQTPLWVGNATGEAALHWLSTEAIDLFTWPQGQEQLRLKLKQWRSWLLSYQNLRQTNHQLSRQVEAQNISALEKERQQAEDIFNKAFHSSPNPITITSLKDGRHLEVNETFCRLMGYQREEILGRTALELNFWVRLEDRVALFQKLMHEGGVKNYEFEFRTKHGDIRTAILSTEIIYLHGEECVLSLSSDITERKRAEAALKKANQRLQRLAQIDPLTRIANRRRFNDSLMQLWHLCSAPPVPLSLILVDVDHFKKYNDYYGHQAGDHCLQRIAQGMTQCLSRPGEILARYGGEEFALLLPNTDRVYACHLAGQLGDRIAALEIEHLGAPERPIVTLSMGVATLIPQKPIPPRFLVEQADRALYEAKRQGRHRYVVAGDWWESDLPHPPNVGLGKEKS